MDNNPSLKVSECCGSDTEWRGPEMENKPFIVRGAEDLPSLKIRPMDMNESPRKKKKNLQKYGMRRSPG